MTHFEFRENERFTLTVACQQVGAVTDSAATLAAAIVQPVALNPMALMTLFTHAAQAGADVTEFRAVWQYSEFVQRVEHALTDGDLASAMALLAVCPVTFTAGTLAALQAVLVTNTLRLVDVVAAEMGEPAPETIDADTVIAVLEAGGYAWDGFEWQKQPEPLPEITAFDVQPSEVQHGQAVTVTWEAGGGASYVKITRNSVPLVNIFGMEGFGLTGSVEDTPTDPGDAAYTLTAYNADHVSVSQSVTVNVIEAEPEPEPGPAEPVAP